MRSGLQMLLTVLLVAGGLGAYHLLVAQPAHAPDPGVGDAFELDPGLPDDPISEDDPVEVPELAGEDEKLARANAVRIEKLERALARALRALKRAQPPGDAPAGGTMPKLSSLDLMELDNPEFDDATLDTLSVYFDEIQRRREAAKQRVRLGQSLNALGLALPDSTRKSVVDMTVRVQGLVEEVSRQNLSPHAHKRALEDLQEEYVEALASILSTEQAEKILHSRMTRRMGFELKKPAPDQRERR